MHFILVYKHQDNVQMHNVQINMLNSKITKMNGKYIECLIYHLLSIYIIINIKSKYCIKILIAVVLQVIENIKNSIFCFDKFILIDFENSIVKIFIKHYRKKPGIFDNFQTLIPGFIK